MLPGGSFLFVVELLRLVLAAGKHHKVAGVRRNVIKQYRIVIRDDTYLVYAALFGML
jgi:hypothetical protein